MHRYQVNALVERGKMEGAPVVFESNPSYHNLFGKVEYRSAFGSMTTDFTMIKPGALHMSNGGYLLIQAAELLSHPFSWTMLKRTLKTRQIRIENLLEERALISTAGIKPEPIPLDVKVVLIGSPYLYHLLSEWDEDFHKIFKVKVEFDPDMEKTKEHALEFAAFVKRTAEKESLLPFHRDALAVLLNHSSRMAGDQRKLSTRLQEIEKILVEASFWAREAGETVARAEHIKQALSEQRYRSNRIEERIQEMIADGSIMIDTDGFVVGQINGLAALRTRDYSFGQPHRITAKTYLGRSGILNIERETSLSGSFHDKGVLILSGYLNGKFAQKRPLPISASIAFEQTYSYIDGDSASSAELFALLSSLSETPIDQGIAVTGSVNQNGQLQPVGAVNEKIEAFFDVCVQRGLTGRQGALVPRQNIVHLVLKDEVARAVENGQFHIWAAETVEEGIEILTGEKAETVFQRIERRLDEMTERWKALDAKEKDKSDSSPEITD